MNRLIEVKHVSKKFCRNLRRSMKYALTDTFKGFFGRMPLTETLRRDEFWAVSDISLEVVSGDTLGIVGQNGSGKTSLLRLLSGIIPPDTGAIHVFGRIGTLLTIGAGFHPYMSVRDNIFLEGVHLGMSTKEIAKKLDFIRDLSGIGDFFDAPVAALSSGMRVRLGFSIALSVHPDVLLVDEILSVADEEFRERCIKEIHGMRENGAVILVSHNHEFIQTMCNRIVVLEKGSVAWSGNDVHKGIAYLHRKSVGVGG